MNEIDRKLGFCSSYETKIVFCLFFPLLVFPLLFIFRRSEWIAHSFKVFLGKATWVGLNGVHKQSRPNIINAVENEDVRVRERLNLAYARKYNWFEDLKLVLNALLLQSVN